MNSDIDRKYDKESSKMHYITEYFILYITSDCAQQIQHIFKYLQNRGK